MCSYLLAVIPDGPGAIEVLSGEDGGSGMASTWFAGRDVDDEASQADAVVVGDGGFVCEGDLQVAFTLGELTEGGATLLRSLGEAAVVARDEVVLEPPVGLIEMGDAVEGELSDEPVLEDSEGTFDPSLGLGGVGRDGFDADLLEGCSQMGREPNQ